jgi:hypothetical protein
LQKVLAHLGLVLLLQSVELALITIEIVEVALLSQMSHNFAWGIVEILLWLSIGVQLSSVALSTFFAS